MIKNFIKFLLIKISRIIYWATPEESKKKSSSQLSIKLSKKLVDETFENFENCLKKSLLFENVEEIREYAIKSCLNNDKQNELYNLEFGVWLGISTNFFSRYVKKLYAFDSFEGLNEDWAGTNRAKGDFNLNKKIPKLNINIEPVIGRVEDTLDKFLKLHNPKINFVHFDMDTYSPTKFTLERIKPYLVEGAIIIFDELYNFIGWENGEYKALKEVFKDEEFEYKAFLINGPQCVIKIK
ncbi:class I SAM-dependent methyltransferase [Candidatus Pelagibacter sp.]|nr:class I SAM-dependent methyltransferase [Candidatus Pelagibacter sp.]